MTARKKRIWPGLAAVTLLAALLFGGCPQSPEPARYTISFDSHGGSGVAAITGDEGAKVEEPAAPTKEGKTFTGWYSAAEGGTLYAWPHTLEADVTMHARWQDNTQPPVQHTITFNSHDGSPVEDITADAGTLVAQPGDPAKEGYAFAGWYSAETQGTLYTWPHTLTGDVTMHARWRDTALPPPAQHTITFDSQEGSAVDPVTADAGTQVAKPGEPLREGYAFQGWYDAASGGTEYTAWPHTLTGDVTMYAHWRENEPDFPAPANLRAAVSGDNVELVWDSVQGAALYEFWYSAGNADSGGAQWYQDVEDPVFTMEQLSRGIVWYFWIKAKKADGTRSPFSERAQAVLPVQPPDAASIVASPDNNALIVVWEPADGATGYLVYTSESSLATSAVPKNSIDDPAITWTTLSGLVNGKTYYIWIKSKYGSGNLSELSARKSGVPGEPGDPATPVLYATGQVYGGLSGTDRICLVWNPAANATSYEIAWNTVDTTAGASTASNIYGTSYLLGGKTGETLVSGSTYYLWVRAKAGSKESAITPSVSVKLGERLPEAYVGTFLSRWPDVEERFAGERPYYMDGHRVGPISEMAGVFPWNVAGRESPIGPSPGLYEKVAEPYPLPGIMRTRRATSGMTHLSPVSPSGYALDAARDQYVFYDGLVMGMAVCGVVRAVIYRDGNYIAVCELEKSDGTSELFDLSFSRANNTETPPYKAVFGLQRLGQSPFSDPANIEAGQLNAALRSFVNGGVAYPSIRLGWRGGGKSGTENLEQEDPSIPYRDYYNPLLIRPEIITGVVNPLLAAAGVGLPGGWWTKTTASAEPLDQRIVDAFWAGMLW